MKNYAIGWDIGGAHVKVAVCCEEKIIAIHQQPCLLWQGLDKLENTVKTLLCELPTTKNQKHAITMTGELVDLFDNRRDGVEQIIHTMTQLLADFEIHFFCGKEGLLPVEKIEKEHYNAIASANWLASATFAAQRVKNSLFVDIGSTTTDILLCENGVVNAQGYSDYERLISKELIYTGIVRTPVMAVVQSVVDNEQQVGIMAEYFATMADVYRLTGELSERHDQTPTADGHEKTIIASAKRLSRMVGDNFKVADLARWQAVAKNIRRQQVARIQESCVLQLNRTLASDLTIVGAGVGRFLVREMATNLNYSYADFSTLCLTNPDDLIFNTADCAPALAVAKLLT